MNSAWGSHGIKYLHSDIHGKCLWKIDGMSFIRMKKEYFNQRINNLIDTENNIKTAMYRAKNM